MEVQQPSPTAADEAVQGIHMQYSRVRVRGVIPRRGGKEGTKRRQLTDDGKYHHRTDPSPGGFSKVPHRNDRGSVGKFIDNTKTHSSILLYARLPHALTLKYSVSTHDSGTGTRFVHLSYVRSIMMTPLIKFCSLKPLSHTVVGVTSQG